MIEKNNIKKWNDCNGRKTNSWKTEHMEESGIHQEKVI